MTDAPFAVLVEVDVDADEVDLVSGRLWLAGAVAIEEVTQDDGRVRLRTTTTEAGDVDRLVDAIAPSHRATLVPLHDDTWTDAWRAHARAQRAGEHLIVCPTWVDVGDDLTPTDLDVVIRFDPGRAFGSGAHPSTRLALAGLERTISPGCSVLDVGCGSGVLSLAAAALGAARVVAIDVDPEAVRATQANVDAGDLGEVIHVDATALAEVPGHFDLVVANILAVVLRELADGLVARVAPGGRLVVAGALAAQAPDLLDAFAGLELVGRTDLDGWVGFELRAPISTR